MTHSKKSSLLAVTLALLMLQAPGLVSARSPLVLGAQVAERSSTSTAKALAPARTASGEPAAAVAPQPVATVAAAAPLPSATFPSQLVPLAERVMFGAFTYGGVWQGLEPITRLEAALGRQLDIVHWFTNFDNDYYPEMVAAVSVGGRLPLISWQPHGKDVRDIAGGLHDDYLRAWARGVRDSGVTVFLRPFPEMNGEWVSWNGDPEGLRAAWRHMAAVFAAEGADNVRWVFSPNVTDQPATEANRMEAYYPGSDVVDVLALDGYNWGTSRPWTTWRAFEEVFASGYDRITALGTQPVWFAEMASSSTGGDKAEWVASMFASTAFERLQALVWFDENKETDWRIVADADVADAFRSALGRMPARPEALFASADSARR